MKQLSSLFSLSHAVPPPQGSGDKSESAEEGSKTPEQNGGWVGREGRVTLIFVLQSLALLKLLTMPRMGGLLLELMHRKWSLLRL